jgi:hypothetical protein
MDARVVLLASLVAFSAAAQDSASTPPTNPPATPPKEPVPRDRSVIGGVAGNGLRGVAGVNVAAGIGNAQANVRAISAAAGGTGAVSAHQRVATTGLEAQRDARAVLTGAALGASDGLLGLNQAAGSANAQLNVFVAAPGATAAFAQHIDNASLAATQASTAPTPPDDSARAPLRQARIEGAAIGGATGVVQVNQTAGAGNASANVIVLQLPGSTP